MPMVCIYLMSPIKKGWRPSQEAHSATLTVIQPRGVLGPDVALTGPLLVGL